MTEKKEFPDTNEAPARSLVRTLPEALKKFQWVPGQSGNPSGNPPRAKEIRLAFRSYSFVALNVLLDLMACDDHATRFRAAECILTRGFGKGEAVVPDDQETPPEDRAGATYDWNRLTNDEWTALKRVRTELKALLAKAAVPAAVPGAVVGE